MSHPCFQCPLPTLRASCAHGGIASTGASPAAQGSGIKTPCTAGGSGSIIPGRTKTPRGEAKKRAWITSTTTDVSLGQHRPVGLCGARRRFQAEEDSLQAVIAGRRVENRPEPGSGAGRGPLTVRTSNDCVLDATSWRGGQARLDQRCPKGRPDSLFWRSFV